MIKKILFILLTYPCFMLAADSGIDQSSSRPAARRTVVYTRQAVSGSLFVRQQIITATSDDIPTRGPRTSEEVLARLAATKATSRNSILSKPGQQKNQKQHVTFEIPTTIPTQTDATDWIDLQPVLE